VDSPAYDVRNQIVLDHEVAWILTSAWIDSVKLIAAVDIGARMRVIPTIVDAFADDPEVDHWKRLAVGRVPSTGTDDGRRNAAIERVVVEPIVENVHALPTSVRCMARVVVQAAVGNESETLGGRKIETPEVDVVRGSLDHHDVDVPGIVVDPTGVRGIAADDEAGTLFS